MVAHVLVDSSDQRVPVRLINLDDHPIRLKRNYLLGELHSVDNLIEFSSMDDPGKVQRFGGHTKKFKTCNHENMVSEDVDQEF